MPGRFTLQTDLGALQQRFRFSDTRLAHSPRFNSAPTQETLVVANLDVRQAEYMRWGLVPFWAEDLFVGNRMINAKAETVATNPALGTALKKRRCLILADGSCEWKKTRRGKRPMRIVLKSGERLPLLVSGRLREAPTESRCCPASSS